MGVWHAKAINRRVVIYYRNEAIFFYDYFGNTVPLFFGNSKKIGKKYVQKYLKYKQLLFIVIYLYGVFTLDCKICFFSKFDF